jgi:hypothetical protein
MPETTVVNVRIHGEAIEEAKRAGLYVAAYRPYYWGNPFVIGKDGTRDEVIAMYEARLRKSPKMMKRLPELKGKVLGCFCVPLLRCHAEVLARLADEA